MKFKHAWRAGADPISISAAVESSLDGRDYDLGSLEAAAATADNAAGAFARLVEMLHDKGVLSDEDVVSFVSGTWRPVW